MQNLKMFIHCLKIGNKQRKIRVRQLFFLHILKIINIQKTLCLINYVLIFMFCTYREDVEINLT